MDENDRTQLKLVQQGDGQALVALYDRYSRIVYSVALRVLRSPACAEDVLQEIFMQIWRSPERCLSGAIDLAPWMALVSRNRSIDVIRARRPSDSVEDCILPSTFNLAHEAEQNLMCEKARILISHLPEEQQEALEMAFFQGMSHTEIAAASGCPLGTIKSRIRSALLVVRKGLQAECIDSALPAKMAS